MPAKRTSGKKPAPTKRKQGRPSKYAEAVAAEICERLSDGEPLAVICRDTHMPDRSTVFDWTESDQNFSQRIARARRDGYNAIACRLRETARGKGDSTGNVLRDRLIVETDLKLLAKWAPKEYGEKIDVNANVTGEIRVIVGGDAQ